MRRILPLFLLLLVACSSAGPLEVTRSRRFETNTTPEETELLIRLAEQWLREEGHDLRRFVVKKVRVDGEAVFLTGCALPHWWAASVLAIRRPEGWQIASFDVNRAGLHSPPEPCP